MRALILLAVLVFAGFVGVNQVLYTVDETQFVVITRFGEVIGDETEPGLKVKLPFVDTVNRLDKRLLRVDVPADRMLDKDSQFLVIDAFVRYRIVDPIPFRERLINEDNAARRISDLTISELRSEIGDRIQAEIIGGRKLLDEDGREVKDAEGRTVLEIVKHATDDQGNVVLDPQGQPVLIILSPGETVVGLDTRDSITRRVRDRVDERVREESWGIDIFDVRIKRADFPENIEGDVFARMQTERSILAQQLRAEGQEEFDRITAKVTRDVVEIEAVADKESNELRGSGQGEATSILGKAFSCDAEFFSFRRSLEAYATFLPGNSTVVLPADTPLLQFLQSPLGTQSASDAVATVELTAECVALIEEALAQAASAEAAEAPVDAEPDEAAADESPAP